MKIMKLMNIKMSNIAKNIAITTPFLLTQSSCPAQNNSEKSVDTFIKTEEPIIADISSLMEFAPEVEVGKEGILPIAVIDLSKNKLYHYDFCGILDKTYPIYSSKKAVKITPGLKVITHLDKTQENKEQDGIMLSDVDTRTGEIIKDNTQIIYGTDKPRFLKKNDKQDAILVNNSVLQILNENLENEQYILIK